MAHSSYLKYSEKFAELLHNQFSNELSVFGERSVGLPCVYLYPNTDTTRDGFIHWNNYLGFRFSIGSRDFFRDFKVFSDGKKEWELPQRHLPVLVRSAYTKFRLKR